MLLRSTGNYPSTPADEPMMMQLILQQRYAELYQLLIGQQPIKNSSLYNLALCLHWSGNYKGAIGKLETIHITQSPHTFSQNMPDANREYVEIRNKQNQTNDHLLGISDGYLTHFPDLVQDAIIRLKTDCWLQLGDYAKVIATATPIAHKGYKNINDAIRIAQSFNDKQI